MFGVSEATLKSLRERFPKGCRIKLVYMNDPYNTKLHAGCRGTVTDVDDIGTIHVSWDCGSSLGVVYGEDSCKMVNDDE